MIVAPPAVRHLARSPCTIWDVPAIAIRHRGTALVPAPAELGFSSFWPSQAISIRPRAIWARERNAISWLSMSRCPSRASRSARFKSASGARRKATASKWTRCWSRLKPTRPLMDLPAPVSGILIKILKRDGEEAAPGDVIGRIEQSGASATGSETAKTAVGAARSRRDRNLRGNAALGPQRSPRRRKNPTRCGLRPRLKRTGRARHVLPAARRLLAQHGLEPGDVEATGRGGRLLKEDVLRHIESENEEGQVPRRRLMLPPVKAK